MRFGGAVCRGVGLPIPARGPKIVAVRAAPVNHIVHGCGQLGGMCTTSGYAAGAALGPRPDAPC